MYIRVCQCSHAVVSSICCPFVERSHLSSSTMGSRCTFRPLEGADWVALVWGDLDAILELRVGVGGPDDLPDTRLVTIARPFCEFWRYSLSLDGTQSLESVVVAKLSAPRAAEDKVTALHVVVCLSAGILGSGSLDLVVALSGGSSVIGVDGERVCA